MCPFSFSVPFPRTLPNPPKNPFHISELHGTDFTHNPLPGLLEGRHILHVSPAKLPTRLTEVSLSWLHPTHHCCFVAFLSDKFSVVFICVWFVFQEEKCLESLWISEVYLNIYFFVFLFSVAAITLYVLNRCYRTIV